MKNLIKKYTTEQGQKGLWFVDPKMAKLTQSMAIFMARTTGYEFVVEGNTIRKVS